MSEIDDEDGVFLIDVNKWLNKGKFNGIII
jgi:hypothetical protein